MELVNNARDQLTPLISQVLGCLDEGVQVMEVSFFTLLLVQLNQMQEAEDLMQFFFELSTTAFQGFTFSTDQAQLIDALLATSEDIAHALSIPALNAQ